MDSGQLHMTVGMLGLAVTAYQDPKIRQRHLDEIERGSRQFDAARRAFEPLPQDAEESKLWQRFVPVFEEWQRKAHAYIDVQREKGELLARGLKTTDSALVEVDARVIHALAETRSCVSNPNESSLKLSNTTKIWGDSQVRTP